MFQDEKKARVPDALRPRRRLMVASVSATLALAACTSADEQSEIGEISQDLVVGPQVVAAWPISAQDLPAIPDEAFLHATHSLAAADWTAKWQESLKVKVMFFRAFPAGFHKDLKQAPAARRLGRETMCAGDAHPGNFGFQRLGGKTRFIYNDFDDSGYCPVAYDALRYFVALRIFFDDDDVNDSVLEAYVDVVKDPSRAEALDKDLLPDWGDVRAKGLETYTSGQKFLLEGDLHAPSKSARTAVTAAVAKVAWLKGAQVLDVTEIDRRSGGSGGLDRYWALLQLTDKRTIVEFKQAAKPGTEHGVHAKALPPASRLSILQTQLWGYSQPDALATVTILNKAFIVRDRLLRKSIDVLQLKVRYRDQVLRVQAAVLADMHREAWKGVSKDMMRSWLKASAKVVAKRWSNVYNVAGGQ